MRLCPSLSIAVVLALGVVLAPTARAQEWALDAKLLDPAAAQPKAKKGRQQAAAKPADSGKSDKGKVENRQFGELEGWSPGKSPPKKKEDEKDSRPGPGGKAPVNMTPSGGMSVGMPF